MSHIETGPNCSLTSNVFFRAATTSISTASIILLLESLDLFPSYKNLFFFLSALFPAVNRTFTTVAKNLTIRVK